MSSKGVEKPRASTECPSLLSLCLSCHACSLRSALVIPQEDDGADLRDFLEEPLCSLWNI